MHSILPSSPKVVRQRIYAVKTRYASDGLSVTWSYGFELGQRWFLFTGSYSIASLCLPLVWIGAGFTGYGFGVRWSFEFFQVVVFQIVGPFIQRSRNLWHIRYVLLPIPARWFVGRTAYLWFFWRKWCVKGRKLVVKGLLAGLVKHGSGQLLVKLMYHWGTGGSRTSIGMILGTNSSFRSKMPPACLDQRLQRDLVK